MGMSSRERVLAAINHRQPDRVPIDLGSTRNSSIHVSAYARLREALAQGSAVGNHRTGTLRVPPLDHAHRTGTLRVPPPGANPLADALAHDRTGTLRVPPPGANPLADALAHDRTGTLRVPPSGANPLADALAHDRTGTLRVPPSGANPLADALAHDRTGTLRVPPLADPPAHDRTGRLRVPPPRVLDVHFMTAWLDLPVVEALGIDVLTVPRLTWSFGLRADAWQPWRLEDGTSVQMPANYHPETAPDGTILLYQAGELVGRRSPENPYFDRVSDFAEHDTLPDLDRLPMPLLSDEELTWRRGWAERLRAETDKALVGDFGAVLGRWGSYQQWLLALASDPAYVVAYYQRKIDNLLANMQRYAHAVGDLIDVVWLGEDFGTQAGLMLSPRTFAELIAPHYRRLFEWVHAHTSWKVLFHSCGGIYPIIGQLIDCGVDILNPVQANAAGMAPARLKQQFGDRLAFWGGGIDTQTTLPFGTPAEIQAQVRERIDQLAPGGGFVFAAGHNIQADVPVANLLAMFDAVHTHGQYSAMASA